MARGKVYVRVKRNQLPEIARKLPIARRVILGRRGVEMLNIARQLSRFDEDNTTEKHMVEGWEWHETHHGGALTNDVAHTPFNEYGTVNMPAAPMARPAAEQVFPLIIDDFRNLERYIK